MSALAGQAILLRSVDYGESDRIVHLLTETSGRLTAIAKAARRSHRRFPGTLDVFNCLAIEGRFRPRSSMAFLEKARLLDPHLELRREAGRYALASFLIEMLDRMSPEGLAGEEAERLFGFARESLALLCRGPRPTPTLRLLLELRAFDALGLRPELARCVRCGRVAGEEVDGAHRVHFHVADGGLVCTRCSERLDGLVPAELRTLRALEAGLSESATQLDKIELSGHALVEASRLVFRFQRYHAGMELRSERFLEETLPIEARAEGTT